MAIAPVEITFWTDAHTAVQMAELVALRLSPAPLAGFLTGYVEPHLKQEVESAFNSESDPAGEQWAELAPETIQRRLDEGFSAGPIQYRTGEMFNFFQAADSDIVATQVGTSMSYPSGDQIDSGSGKLRYKIGSAQMGNRRTGAPPRPMLGLTIHDLEYVMMGLLEYIIGVRLP